MVNNMDYIIKMYLLENYSQLNRIEEIVELITNGSEFEEYKDEILRILHTLKGSAAMMEYTNITTTTHKLEEGVINLEKNCIEHIIVYIDFMREEMNRLSLDKLSYIDTREEIKMPLNAIFNNIKNLNSNMCLQLNKDVEICCIGGDINVSQDTFSSIQDMLIHIVRNSMDHGIEAKEERIKKGKSEKGKITIKITCDAYKISIVAEDDGRGMDADAIKKIAAQKGLIQNDKIISKNDVLKLVLLPGFSTTSNPNEVSGRGVGMDVVNTKVKSLNGIIDIKSEINKGTKILINIPNIY